MTAKPPVRIDVVSDVVCPWCFIGKRRLEKAIALKPDIPVEVHWRPYYLNDWVPREGISRNDYLTAKFGSPERYKEIAGRVQQAAAAEGLTYAVDKISRQPNTADAHRLIRWAEAIGKAGPNRPPGRRQHHKGHHSRALLRVPLHGTTPARGKVGVPQAPPVEDLGDPRPPHPGARHPEPAHPRDRHRQRSCRPRRRTHARRRRSRFPRLDARRCARARYSWVSSSST